MVEKSDHPPSGPTVETRQAKRARQSAAASNAVGSSSGVDVDRVSATLQSFAESLNNMNQSNLNMAKQFAEVQATMQQSLADQARENKKLMMKQQEGMNRRIAESQNTMVQFTENSIKGMLGAIPDILITNVSTLNPLP